MEVYLAHIKGGLVINKLSNNKIKEIQYLYLDKCLTQDQISHQLHISKATVSKYLKGARFDLIKGTRRALTNMNLRTAKKVTTPTPTSTKMPTENESKVSQLASNPSNNVSKASSVSSPASNATPVKNHPTSNLTTVSTPPKTPENTDNTPSTIWGLIKYDVIGSLKLLINDIKSKFNI